MCKLSVQSNLMERIDVIYVLEFTGNAFLRSRLTGTQKRISSIIDERNTFFATRFNANMGAKFALVRLDLNSSRQAVGE